MNPRQTRNLRMALALAWAFFIFAVCATGQTPPPTQPQTAATPPPAAAAPAPSATQAVSLNVLVTDEKNRLVANLRQEDFRVEEDGVPQAITHFSAETSPVSYALVVDNSGSLRSLLGYLTATAGSLVENNRPGDETMVVRFVSSDNINVLQPFTSNQAALLNGLAGMYVEGGQTAVIDAVYISAKAVAERRKDEGGRRRRALVLLTDGEDRMSYYNLSDLQNLLRHTDVQVFAVGLVQNLDKDSGFSNRKNARQKALDLLNTLAKETGGRAYFPKTVTGLMEAVAEISTYLRTQYVIGYQTANKASDGKFRKVEVKLSETAKAGGAQRTVTARPGYLAPGAVFEEKSDSKDKKTRARSR
jgi:Ca-activated chloride channel homolog